MGYKINKIRVGTNLVRPDKMPGYQEVEYIQSSGTQYIDTGYIPSNSTKLTMSMGGYSQSITYSCLFGARLAWASSAASGKGFVIGREIDVTPTCYVMFGGYYSNINDSTFSYKDGNNHIIELSQSGAYEDGVLKKSVSSVTFTSPVPLTLFAGNDNGTVGEQGKFKMYYTKILDNGTLVRDFIPCYRKSDSVIGLYDLVNNQFYTNSGTGTFTKGPDVN